MSFSKKIFQLFILINKLYILIHKLLIFGVKSIDIFKSMHERTWDRTLGFDEHLDRFSGKLELAVNQLLATSILVRLIQLEVEHDFLQVCVVHAFCGILKLGCLLDVEDAVMIVNLLQVDQWNPLFSVHID